MHASKDSMWRRILKNFTKFWELNRHLVVFFLQHKLGAILWSAVRIRTKEQDCNGRQARRLSDPSWTISWTALLSSGPASILFCKPTAPRSLIPNDYAVLLPFSQNMFSSFIFFVNRLPQVLPCTGAEFTFYERLLRVKTCTILMLEHFDLLVSTSIIIYTSIQLKICGLRWI